MVHELFLESDDMDGELSEKAVVDVTDQNEENEEIKRSRSGTCTSVHTACYIPT